MQQGQVFELKKSAVAGSPVAEFVHPTADDSTADTCVPDGEPSVTHPHRTWFTTVSRLVVAGLVGSPAARLARQAVVRSDLLRFACRESGSARVRG
jgi:hypothetical protein